ncbi:MAG: COX15/CtaA family protein [Gammaproteobacteria bacterium]|nr:COX15/CtaA family protein [Gammaproteobacteria bacterium]
MVKTKKNLFTRLAFLATILAFVVVILGAYTRLKDAGLGCPDWPGCYGQLIVPKTQSALASASKLYPQQPVEPTKAWAEMTHRYFAGSLGLLIMVLAGWSFLARKKDSQHPRIVPQLLIACVIFQALLGMWTVTWQLLPLVVMGHLLGGMTIVALLWWLTLDTGRLVTHPPANSLNYLKPWVILGVVIVFLQIFLGGWTSANYASIVCPDFPYCQGQLFPKFNFSEAFNFFSPIGKNYQGGILGESARVTIQMTHRYGAFITTSYILSLTSYVLFSNKTSALKNTMGMIFLILTTQIFLGILNIATLLYLPIAVSHNAVALLLLLSMLTLLYQLTTSRKSAVVLVAKQPPASHQGMPTL